MNCGATLFQLNRFVTSCLPTAPIARADSGSLNARRIELAKSSGLGLLTKAAPTEAASDERLARELITTGVPQAIASKAEKPNVSVYAGKTVRSAAPSALTLS